MVGTSAPLRSRELKYEKNLKINMVRVSAPLRSRELK